MAKKKIFIGNYRKDNDYQRYYIPPNIQWHDDVGRFIVSHQYYNKYMVIGSYYTEVEAKAALTLYLRRKKEREINEAPITVRSLYSKPKLRNRLQHVVH
jgi:hypothetical protein